MVNREHYSELQDVVLASEIELLSDLIEAVARAGRQLSPTEIDGALGVAQARAHAATPADDAARAPTLVNAN